VRNNLKALLLPMAKVNKSRERGESDFQSINILYLVIIVEAIFMRQKTNDSCKLLLPPLCSMFDLILRIIMTLYRFWR